MTKTLVIWMVVGLSVLTAAQQQQNTDEKAETSAPTQVRRVLDDQVTAWNKGDLEGYMAGYWKSPDLTFFSNDSETTGWQSTLDRYKKRYQSSGQSMGKLDFPGSLQVTMLAKDAAFVRGRWHLMMPDGKEHQGVFTLIFRQIDGEWKIIHDHSSGE